MGQASFLMPTSIGAFRDHAFLATQLPAPSA